MPIFAVEFNKLLDYGTDRVKIIFQSSEGNWKERGNDLLTLFKEGFEREKRDFC